jgi:hypothetical protein
MVYESRQNGFRTWRYFSTSVSYRYFGTFLLILLQNHKITAYFISSITPKTDFLAYAVEMV